MQELLAQFAALDEATQLAIMAALAALVVKVLRACGLDEAPGYQSILASMFVGVATGFAATGWQGAVLGAFAGLVATGAHQLPKQYAKRIPDMIEAEQRRLPFD
jgi:hypothetical protein